MENKISSKMVKELYRLYLYSILLVLLLIGGTLRSFAQCADPTITRKDYCPSQPAYINVVDNTVRAINNIRNIVGELTVIIQVTFNFKLLAEIIAG